MNTRLDALIDLPDINGNKGRSSVKVKTMQRGFRPEADAVLDTLVSSEMYRLLGKRYNASFDRMAYQML